MVECNYMNTIGVREFQQNFHKTLEQLPVMVTKKGKPIALILPPDSAAASVEVIENKVRAYEAKAPEVMYCTHGRPARLCKSCFLLPKYRP